MKSVDALALRQSLGRVLKALERDGAPVLVERRRRPAAVLISLRDYQERFADRDADERRREIVERINATRVGTRPKQTTLDMLRRLRAGSE